jgi:hypothetical protein
MNNPNKALWENGDFTRIAASLRGSGEAFAKEPWNYERAQAR